VVSSGGAVTPNELKARWRAVETVARDASRFAGSYLNHACALGLEKVKATVLATGRAKFYQRELSELLQSAPRLAP